MTAISTTYSTQAAARDAVAALRDTHVPARAIRLLARRKASDVRREPVGGFAGPVAPDAPVGTYAGRTVLRSQGTGSFAGDADRQRQGSFADTDRVEVVSFTDDAAGRVRVTGLRGARRLLSRALDDEAVDRAVKALHRGHAIVVVELNETDAGAARGALERLAAA